MPFANTDTMQRHIDEIALNVARGAHAVLLLDRAGWQTTANLAWPKNITPILLPSRSPELNSAFAKQRRSAVAPLGGSTPALRTGGVAVLQPVSTGCAL
ncbi:hypothetical protein J8I29_28570 [Labrys sp. LIt4]|nr:hypothetical protein [Labrys sp. LIt4]